MIRRCLPTLLLLAISITLRTTLAQDKEEKLISGPQAGSLLPGPCEVYNVNGPTAKGRFHCLVCEYGSEAPVVMIFAHEPKKNLDAALESLLLKLDEAIETHKESGLRAFVVFLSEKARTSATDKEAGKDADKTEKIVEEAISRAWLLERLEKRVKDLKLKSLVLACTVPEGPKSYKLDARADVTVIFYQKLRVLKDGNYAFAAGKMTPADADAIMANVDRTLKEAMKKPAGKKK